MYQMSHNGENWIVSKNEQILIEEKTQHNCWKKLTQNFERDQIEFKSPMKLVRTSRGKYISKYFAFAEYPEIVLGYWEGYKEDWKCVPGIDLSVKNEAQLRKLCRDYNLTSKDYVKIASKIEALGFELND